jgi:DNA helicase-2/ATP-dependent DNA helicase PcrA
MTESSITSEEGTQRIKEIVAIIESLHTKARRANVTELYLDVLKQSGLLGWIQTLPEPQQIENYDLLQQFLTRLKSFEEQSPDKTLPHFLEELEHERQAGETGSINEKPEEGPDVVNIMTCHGAKGLEFPYVFIINLVEQRFPSRARREAIPLPDGLAQSTIDHDHIQEERRLFYVALTRAKEGLYLLASKDYGGKRARKVSRFVTELNIAADKGESANQIDETVSIETELPTAIKGHELKRVSFTQLAAFSKCPLQYKYAHILRIPIFGKHQMSFGKSMHNTLQHFLEQHLNQTNNAQTSLFDTNPEPEAQNIPTLKDLLKLYEQNWINEWYPTQEIKEEYQKKGKDSLTEYHKILTETKPEIAFIEKGFTIKIGDITIKGRIDRIDKTENAYEIVDYKTGSPKKDGKLSWDDKKQLILYAIAGERCFDPPLNITKLTYHYLENNTSVSFEPKDELKEKLIEEVKSSVNAIRTSDFAPSPGFHCNFCDFKDICEFAQTSA